MHADTVDHIEHVTNIDPLLCKCINSLTIEALKYLYINQETKGLF